MVTSKIQFLRCTSNQGVFSGPPKAGIRIGNCPDIITHTTCDGCKHEIKRLCLSWPLDRQFPIIPANGLNCRVGLGSLFQCSKSGAVWLKISIVETVPFITFDFLEICFKLL